MNNTKAYDSEDDFREEFDIDRVPQEYRLQPPRDIATLEEVIDELEALKTRANGMSNHKAGAKLSKMADQMILQT